MGIARDQAKAVCRAAGRGDLLAFLVQLDDAEIATWELEDQDQAQTIVSYIDEVKKQGGGAGTFQAGASAAGEGTGAADPGHESLPALLTQAVVEGGTILAQRFQSLLRRREFEVSASDVSSTNWDRNVKLILEATHIIEYNVFIAQPCCPHLLPAVQLGHVQLFRWPVDNQEDHYSNITAVTEYLQRNCPTGVTVVAVQGISWLAGEIPCGPLDILRITHSKTDCIFVLEEARSLLSDLSQGSIQALLPYIVAMYEAKLSSTLAMKSLYQAILECLVLNSMRDPSGTFPHMIPVLVGDLRKNYVVHGAGELQGKRLLHVAKPSNVLTADNLLQAADCSTWTRIKGMLGVMRDIVRGDMQARQAPAQPPGPGGSGPTAGGISGGPMGSAGDVLGGGRAGLARGTGNSAALPPGGGTTLAFTNRGLSGTPANTDCDAALEAAHLNAFAQSMLGLLQTPQFYEAVGLSEPPSAYTPPTEEEYFGGLRLCGPGLPAAHPGPAVHGT